MAQISQESPRGNGCGEKSIFRVGTRKSQLAVIQTEHVVGLLANLYPNCTFQITKMNTIGDDILTTPLQKIGEKSLFTKELEVALEQEHVDFVVHSLKDLPSSLPAGLTIAAILRRENPQDAVVLRKDLKVTSLDELPAESVIGTSSLRRAAQLKRRFPHLRFKDVRGNLNTRVKKLDEVDGQFDALILAAAGLIRIGWHDRISIVLPTEDCLHAVGQGALAVECRSMDQVTLDLLRPLIHITSMLCCVLERSFLKYLSDTFRGADTTPIVYDAHVCLQLLFKEGGCSVPCAISTDLTNNQIKVESGVYSLDGSQAVEDSLVVILDRKSEFSNCDQELCQLSVKSSDRKEVDSTYVSIHPQHVDSAALCAAVQGGITMGKKLEEKGAVEILIEARRQAKVANVINARPTTSN